MTAADLAGLGPGPLVLVDVGAAEGLARRWQPLEERLVVVGFEPDERSFAALEPSERRIWLNTALWDRPGTLDVHLARKPENTSVLAPNEELLARFPDSERFEVVGTAQVDATTLDAALDAAPVERADFLKADVQGGELAVLRGARSTLAEAFGVEVEVAFAPLYRDQPLFGDVDAFLRDAGFELVDLRRTYWKRDLYADTAGLKGQLVSGDALYLRPAAAFAPRASRAAIVNALAICALYGYPDLGLELLDAAPALGAEVAAPARELLSAPARYPVERLPGPLRPRAARLAAKVARRSGGFSPRGTWPPSRKRRGRFGDGDLGNS